MKRLTAITIFVFFITMAANAPTASFQVSGDPGPLVIIFVSAGIDPAPVTDNSTNYSLNVNKGNQKITGALDAAMPAYTTLRVTLAAPTGGASTGQILLLTMPQDLVTGITGHLKEKGMTISYEFAATIEAGVIPPSTRTVTFTLTDE